MVRRHGGHQTDGSALSALTLRPVPPSVLRLATAHRALARRASGPARGPASPNTPRRRRAESHGTVAARAYLGNLKRAHTPTHPRTNRPALSRFSGPLTSSFNLRTTWPTFFVRSAQVLCRFRHAAVRRRATTSVLLRMTQRRFRHAPLEPWTVLVIRAELRARSNSVPSHRGKSFEMRTPDALHALT